MGGNAVPDRRPRATPGPRTTHHARRTVSQAEDPDNAPLARVSSEIGCKISGRPHVGGIVGSHVARQKEPVAADAGVDRDVLLAVRSAKRNGCPHDARTDLELPQLPAGARVGGFEPAVPRSQKDDVTGGDDAAAPDREFLFDPPALPPS